MRELIAICGLNCETCDARIATINNDDALREKTAKLWSELNGVPITAEMINCMGCRAIGVKTPFCSTLCLIRQCALKNELDTCGDCPKMEYCKTVGAIHRNNKEAMDRLKQENT